MQTPDITPVAIGAFVVLVVTNGLILFGLDIGPKRESALETLLNGGAVVGFLAHDAWIRAHRAKVAVAEALAKSGTAVTLKA